MTSPRRILSAALLAVLAAPGAEAASVDALILLPQFNIIAIRDLEATQETENPALIGRDLIVTNPYNVNNDQDADGTVGSVSGALIVGRNVESTGVNTVRVQTGNARIGGTVTPAGAVTVQSGSGTVETGVTGIPSPEELEADFVSLSEDLRDLADTPGASFDDSDFNLKRLTAGAGGSGNLTDVSILTLPQSFLDGGVLSTLDIAADQRLILNVPGEMPTININGTGNFVSQGSRVLFNFYEATRINLNSGFSFNILAPLASVFQGGTALQGNLVANRVIQGAEIRDLRFIPTPGLAEELSELPPPSPTAVPLPAGAVLLLGALGALAAPRLRRPA